VALAVEAAQPVAVAGDAWLFAPAIRKGATAWLRVPAASGDPATPTRHAGDVLVVRRGGSQRRVYDGGCSQPLDCATVRDPAAAAGRFAFAVTPNADTGYLAAVGNTGAASILYADETGEPASLVWSVDGDRIVWALPAGILSRPLDGDAAAETIVPGRDLEGDVVRVAASRAGVAWIARRRDADALYVAGPGAAPRLVRTEGARGLAGVALAPDGAVISVRRVSTPTGRRERFEVMIDRAGAEPVRISQSAAVPVGSQPPMPRVDGSLVVFRTYTTLSGGRELVLVYDLASGARARVTQADRRLARLSDPAVAGRRVIWTRSDLVGQRLVRSSVLVSVIRERK